MDKSLFFVFTLLGVCLLFFLFIPQCTLSFSTTSNMTHDGVSTDTQEDSQTPNYDIKPALTIPVSATSTPSIPAITPSATLPAK